MKTRLSLGTALAALFALGGPAVAAPGPPPPAPPLTNTSPESPKREAPDYGGRPPPPATAGDVALWIPRIVFFPLYLTSEYVLRRPIGAFLVTAGQKNWPAS